MHRAVYEHALYAFENRQSPGFAAQQRARYRACPPGSRPGIAQYYGVAAALPQPDFTEQVFLEQARSSHIAQNTLSETNIQTVAVAPRAGNVENRPAY